MWLADTWPQCFFLYEKRRKPLAIGIHRDIIAAQPDIDVRELSTALRIYVSNHCYLRNCREGAGRVDLDGNIVGEVSAEDAKSAAARRAVRTAKKQIPSHVGCALPTSVATAPRRLSLSDLKQAALKNKALTLAAHKGVVH